MDQHEQFMALAITEARKGLGAVSPNPLVGAVVVKNGQVLSIGYHAHFGGPHAEDVAIRKLDHDQCKESILYVTLEPCNHYGKTPPCTDLILESGIKIIYIGCMDPNPLVSGKGIQKLKDAGLTVVTNILNDACVELNKGFFSIIQKNRPYITLKIAQTLDGFIGTSNGQSRWITGESARQEVHRLRKEHDAVLVGINTIIQDDPELTVRHIEGINPKRVILDSQLRITESARCIRDDEPQRTVVVTSESSSQDKEKLLRDKGCVIWKLPTKSGKIDINELMKIFKENGISSVFIEGGQAVFTSFLKQRLVDRFVCFIAPKCFGQGISSFSDLNVKTPDKAIEFKSVQWKAFGQDICFIGDLG